MARHRPPDEVSSSCLSGRGDKDACGNRPAGAAGQIDLKPPEAETRRSPYFLAPELAMTAIDRRTFQTLRAQGRKACMPFITAGDPDLAFRPLCSPN